MKTTYLHQKGAALMIVVLFFVIISSTLLIGVVNPISNQIRNANEFLISKQSYSVADAQAENTLYRFNNGRSDAPSTLSLLGATASANITDVGDIKQVLVSGLFGQFERNIQAQFRQDVGVAFNYGLQTGTGGVQMSGSSYIVGNVYSNGDIVGDGGSGWYNNYITGSAIAATVSDSVPHIDNTTASTSDSVFDFGQTNTNQDFAQSFVYSTSSPATEIEIYMKKTGTPANATVKIVNDSSGNPGTTVLVSGTLNAVLATSLYSYVPVALTTTTSLVSGTTYWFVIDTPSNNASNYYTLGMNNNIYSGSTKMGRLGNSWANLATTTLDVKFKLMSGGEVGSIVGVGVGTVGTGIARANTVTNTTVSGDLYCQFGSGNNKPCDTSQADPAPANLPISQGNIDEWKSIAETGGSTSSISIGGSNTRTLGPIKINGDLTIDGSGRLNIIGVIYVTGNITVGGSGKIYVDSSMGAASGVLVTDGKVDLGGSGGIYGSGTAGSYVVIASASTCPTGSCGGDPAVEVSGSAGSVVISAPNGTMEITGSANLKSAVAKTLILSGSSSITYESGLASLDFSSGPSGAWAIEAWQEVEDN